MSQICFIYTNPLLPISFYLFIIFLSKLPVLAAAPDKSVIFIFSNIYSFLYNVLYYSIILLSHRHSYSTTIYFHHISALDAVIGVSIHYSYYYFPFFSFFIFLKITCPRCSSRHSGFSFITNIYTFYDIP